MSAPEGFPREATEEMKDAFYRLHSGRFTIPKPAEIWAAMYDAAPFFSESANNSTSAQVKSEPCVCVRLPKKSPETGYWQCPDCGSHWSWEGE